MDGPRSEAGAHCPGLFSAQKIISERAFFVGPTAARQMLVLLGQGMKAGPDAPKTESRKVGQRTSLTGITEALPTQEAVNQTCGLSGTDYAGVQSQKAYLTRHGGTKEVGGRLCCHEVRPRVFTPGRFFVTHA